LVYTYLMKVMYTFLAFVLLGITGGCFYYTNMRHDVTNVTMATSTQMSSSIYVYREYGDISYKNKTDTTYTPLTKSRALISNYSSVTTRDGKGYVVFPDNSTITLSSSTEIEISYEPTKISIMQLIGLTYHRVRTLAAGNKYEVRTLNTLASVRGTKLAIMYNPNTKKTYVAVTEHSVEVTETKEDGTINASPVMVQEGSLAEIQSATSTIAISTKPNVVVRKSEEVLEIKDFIDENKAIDTQYDATPAENKKQFLEKIITTTQNESKNISKATSTKSESDTEVTPLSLVNQTSSTTQPLTPSKSLIILKETDDVFTPEQEAFVNTFYTMYEKLFLVDDPSIYCENLGKTTASAMLSSLLLISNTAGYILPHQTELNSFATDLVNACADGSIPTKASSFVTRFDTTYPY
jgi:hypothetical protein